jgi:hypothetical protein
MMDLKFSITNFICHGNDMELTSPLSLSGNTIVLIRTILVCIDAFLSGSVYRWDRFNGSLFSMSGMDQLYDGDEI